jgi:hypothetical protein
MKSHADFSEGCGMPGVSGELKASGPPTEAGFAKLPGVVPPGREDGLPPTGGSCEESSVTNRSALFLVELFLVEFFATAMALESELGPVIE